MPNENPPAAMPQEEPSIKLKDLSRLQLEPGDVLVVKVHVPISDEARARIIHYMKRELPNTKFILLDQSVDLSVVRKPKR